jgi:hypothetical protein
VRISFAVEAPQRAYYSFYPSLRSPDAPAATLSLVALTATIDGSAPAGEIDRGRHALVFELYPSIVTQAKGAPCRSSAPMPALPGGVVAAPLLVSIEDTTYGSPWRGGREERTRNAYSLAELFHAAAAELPSCPK